MKYSFIVPTYNSERWIQPCINSILAQSYTGFNLIILDSGSTDGTLDWIRSAKDSRINIYTTDQRLGIVENWARIITIPRNEFMTIAGHDDVFYPDYLTTIDDLILNNPGGSLFQTHFNFIDSKGEVIRKCKNMESVIDGHRFLEAILKDNIEITGTGFMVKSADYDNTGGIPPYPDLLYADLALWHYLILKGPLIVSSRTCFGFRTHNDNTSKSFTLQRLSSFEMIVGYIKKLKTTDQQYDHLINKYGGIFLKNFVKGSCHKLIYVPKNRRNNVTIQAIIETGKKCAYSLIGDNNFNPDKDPEIILAKLIDSNSFLRNLFLFWKTFSKRVY